jgi:fatty-acyl-CoA synthase
MLHGLMMDIPLNLPSILEYAGRFHAATEVISRGIDGRVRRYGYGDALDRVRRLAAGLQALGVRPGDRVSTLCWNTRQHFELFYGVPALQAVLHTVNPRLADTHLRYILDHAEPALIVCDAGCAEIVERLWPTIVRRPPVVYVRDEGERALALPAQVHDYESLITASARATFDEFDESTAAVLCYTSGTTGMPKGVLYSHRALMLIAVASLAKDFFGGYRNGDMDTLMPIAGMFHATGWSFPYTAPLAGSRLVLPGRQHEPAALYELLHGEHVTVAAAVPTVLQSLRDWMERYGRELPRLRSILTSGSAPSANLVRRWEGSGTTQIVQTWGMTEALCSSRGTLLPGTRHEDTPPETRPSGRMAWGTRLRLVDDDGRTLPFDGRATGHLQARGPWVASGYYRETSAALTPDGWLDTGDMASIDEQGQIVIRDRAKDIIKSGGEWISSSELEAHALTFPGVQQAAVIAIPHERWQERPLLVVQLEDGGKIDVDALQAHLRERVAKWWLPDRIERVDAMPISATGKILKSELRKRFPA